MAELTLRRFFNRIGFRAIQLGDRSLIFTEADYLEIREARRQCRSRSSRPAKEDPATGRSAGLSEEAISAKLRALRAESSPKRSASNGKTSSSKKASSGRGQVVALPKRS